MRLLGVDVGGTFVKWWTSSGERGKVFSKGLDLESLIGVVRDLVDRVDPDSWGLAVAGLVDKEGFVWKAPNLKVLEEVRVSDLLNPDVIINDAAAAAYGEYRMGAGRGGRVVLMLTLGTGVGGGLVVDGRIFDGANGTGLEPGHMIVVPDGEPCNCGRRGCLEAYFSSYAIEREYRRISGESLKMPEISKRYISGEERARRVVERSVEHLHLGVLNMVTVLNPDVLVLGGGLVGDIPDLVDRLSSMLERSLFASHRLAVRKAELGEFSGACGACLLAASRTK